MAEALVRQGLDPVRAAQVAQHQQPNGGAAAAANNNANAPQLGPGQGAGPPQPQQQLPPWMIHHQQPPPAPQQPAGDAAAAADVLEGGAPPTAAAAPPPPPPPPKPLRFRANREAALPKAIVYSAFQTHLLVVDLALAGEKIPFATLRRAGYGRKERDAALAAFRVDPDTRILLLDRQGAEGLDLSFASHIFLCEPLVDAALEQQVISRAHRMGQRGRVFVEILAMADTAEAQLLAIRKEGIPPGARRLEL